MVSQDQRDATGRGTAGHPGERGLSLRGITVWRTNPVRRRVGRRDAIVCKDQDYRSEVFATTLAAPSLASPQSEHEAWRPLSMARELDLNLWSAR